MMEYYLTIINNANEYIHYQLNYVKKSTQMKKRLEGHTKQSYYKELKVLNFGW